MGSLITKTASDAVIAMAFSRYVDLFGFAFLFISNYSSGDGVLYCKAHYEQLFRETGSYPKKSQCAHGGCFLTPSTYAALDGYLYCKPHFSQLFKEKGSYSYLSKQASLKRSEMQQEQEAVPVENQKTDADRSESEAEAEPEPEPETKEAEQADEEQHPEQDH
ncbi:unnamed protein product [Sphenostylis stenocarpa]|uniref:Uncharacterized protein n=1 Tax=Sphenostylis stenocarpa TaxID=92480 RepID=A0AA86VH48_9FABA|nr:unnamed protein product [Sphenostylis stenocarpa]